MQNDEEPEIILEENSKLYAETRRKMGFSRSISRIVFKENFAGFIETTFVAKHLWRLIRNRKLQEEASRAKGHKYLALDVGLLFFMMGHCVRAKVRTNKRPAGEGKVAVRMMKIGSRVEMTQEEIADMYKVVRSDCTREHVSKQIKLLHTLGIVVAKKRGWCEFDAELCWNGSIEHWKAYREIQHTQFDAVFVMPDGQEIRYKNFMRGLDDYNHEETLESDKEQNKWATIERRERMKSEE